MRPAPATAPGSAVGERAALALLGLVAVLVAAVWLWSGLSGVAGGHGWLAVGLADVPGILVRLPTNAGDLAQAWPTGDRHLLPPEPVMVVCLLLVTAAGLGLAAGVVRLVRRRPSLLPASGRGAAWATRRDLGRLVVRRAGEARVVLGRRGRALVATEARHSVLVLGPTQSGKSTSLAIPALLEWPGPVMATSVKDDLVAATLQWRSTRGRCQVFDPTSGGETSTWSPLAEAGTWAGSQRMAGWLVDAAPARSGVTDGGFWFAAATKLLAPLLLAASRSGGGMREVVRWTDAGNLDEPLGVLDVAGEAEAAVALSAAAQRDPRLRSSITTTLETVLGPFEEPAVQQATATCDIDPATLLTGPHTLYLCGPSHEQARVQGLFAGLVAAVVATAVDLVHRTGAPLDPPLLLVLDEAANIAPLRDLDTLASTAAGLGIQLVTICQDLAQLANRYGPERSRTIANNHRAKLVLSGVSDLGTLDLISGLAGDTAVTESTETRDLRDGRRTRSTAVAYRRLAPTDELRRTRPGTGILVYGHLPPARLTLRPWYSEASLRSRVAT